MRTSVIACIICLLLPRLYAQKRAQAGISGMPLVDVLNLFPENRIGGFALIGNAGVFLTERFSIGAGIMYGHATNSYQFNTLSTDEKLNASVLSITCRQYLQASERMSFYFAANAGTGFISISRSYSNPFAHGFNKSTDPAVAFMAGFGFNYFFTGHLALDLNAAYGLLSILGDADPYFQTVLPTAGIQFFTNGK